MPGEFREVSPVFFERLVRAFRVLAGDSLISSYLLQGRQQAFVCEIEPAKDSTFFHHCQDNVLNTHELVTEFLHPVFSFSQERAQAGSEMNLPGSRAGAMHLSHLGQGLLCCLANGGRRHPGLFKQGSRNPSFLLHQGKEQVFDINALVPPAHGEG